MKQVLVVCSANVCRSPMVAGLINQRLESEGLVANILVASAGTYARPGVPAWGPVCDVMAERGVDLQRHRSQPISSEMIQAADLIIVMEEGHRQSIFYQTPRALRKVFLLSELAGGEEPLLDVFGQPLAKVRLTVDQAVTWLNAGWDQILTRLDLAQLTLEPIGIAVL